jgi:hypothetical protein
VTVSRLQAQGCPGSGDKANSAHLQQKYVPLLQHRESVSTLMHIRRKLTWNAVNVPNADCAT